MLKGISKCGIKWAPSSHEVVQPKCLHWHQLFLQSCIFGPRHWNHSVSFTCALWGFFRCFSNNGIWWWHLNSFINMSRQPCGLLAFIYKCHSFVKVCTNRPERNPQGHFYCSPSLMTLGNYRHHITLWSLWKWTG